jgi:circadian clock protein KaiC
MLTRLIDFLKLQQITAFFTNLSSGSMGAEQTMTEISSLMDVWISVRDAEEGNSRRRLLYILKSRGMAHSNQVREFRISDSGLDIISTEWTGSMPIKGTIDGKTRTAR